MDSPRSGRLRAVAASWALVGIGVGGVAVTSTLAYTDTLKPSVTANPVVNLPAVPAETTTTSDDAAATSGVSQLLASCHRVPRLMTEIPPKCNSLSFSATTSSPSFHLALHPSVGQISELHWRRWSVDMQIVVTDADALTRARLDVDAELDAIESAASRFRPDSEINTLAKSSGRPTEISELLATMLAAALRAARQTDGDVDPTIGAALISLGYDRDIAAIKPAAAMAASATLPASWSMISLDGRIVTVPTGVVLDLGATAKAIAADRCAQRAHESTGCGVLINLGGDIATAGEAPEGGWQVLVQDSADDPASSVALSSGAAMATSSTVHRRWRRDQHHAAPHPRPANRPARRSGVANGQRRSGNLLHRKHIQYGGDHPRVGSAGLDSHAGPALPAGGP